MIEEQQEDIDKYCNLCKIERRFVTSLNPEGHLVCTQCGYRESIIPFNFIQDNFGFRIIKEKK